MREAGTTGTGTPPHTTSLASPRLDDGQQACGLGGPHEIDTVPVRTRPRDLFFTAAAVSQQPVLASCQIVQELGLRSACLACDQILDLVYVVFVYLAPAAKPISKAPRH